MISDSARRCPQCGAYLWTGGRIGCAIIFIIIIVPIIYNCFDNIFNSHTVDKTTVSINPSEAPSPSSTINPYTFNGYTLNYQEQKVIKDILISEFYDYMDGKQTSVSPQIFNVNAINVTSDKLQSDYERNEVAGDQKYRGKTLFISGVVTSIDRSIGENYFISLQGGSNMFMGPHAKMADGYVNYLANLQKGQTVHLVCQGNGMLIGSASLNGCVPANIFIENHLDTWVSNITDQFSKGDKDAQKVVIVSVALASILPNSSDCFGTDKDKFNKCINEIGNEKKIGKADIMVAAEKLKLDLDKIKDSSSPEKGNKTEKDSSSSKIRINSTKGKVLSNIKYTFDYGDTVKLKNGTFERGTINNGIRSDDYRCVTLNDFSLGDLNNDGVEDAAVILEAYYGGNGGGIEEFLFTVINREGKFQHKGVSVKLDDRVLNSIIIKNGIITIDMTGYRPEDAMCCPTLRQIARYQLIGDNLTRLK
jgi:hypothetical protein